jgi:CMP-N,N'-diacetyllegionaminic acid synthase
MKIVSVILARGGSKGILNKNLIDINGYPLLYYTISASKSSNVHETWVSTDSNEIARVASQYGAKVLHRPDPLCTDLASSDDALLHFAENVNSDIIVFIQPTSPLLTAKHINDGLLLHNSYDSVFSAYKEHWIPRWHKLQPHEWSIGNRPRRQDRDELYVENGAFYISYTTHIRKNKLRYSGNIGIYEMKLSESFQIDTYDDVALINTLLRNNRSNKVAVLCRGESLLNIELLPTDIDICILVNAFQTELNIPTISNYVKQCKNVIHLCSFGSQSHPMVDLYHEYGINTIIAPYVAECMPTVPSHLSVIAGNQKNNIHIKCMSDSNKSDMIYNKRYKFTSPTAGMDAILYAVNDLHATDVYVIGMDFYDNSGYLTNSHGIMPTSVAEAINSGEDTKFMQTFLTNFITTKHNTNFNIYTKSQMINLPTNLAYSFIN